MYITGQLVTARFGKWSEQLEPVIGPRCLGQYTGIQQEFLISPVECMQVDIPPVISPKISTTLVAVGTDEEGRPLRRLIFLVRHNYRHWRKRKGSLDAEATTGWFGQCHENLCQNFLMVAAANVPTLSWRVSDPPVQWVQLKMEDYRTLSVLVYRKLWGRKTCQTFLAVNLWTLLSNITPLVRSNVLCRCVSSAGWFPYSPTDSLGRASSQIRT